LIKAADKYGFSVISVSTPDGYWTFPNGGVINTDNLTPCDASDSKDIEYMDSIFDFIVDNELMDEYDVYTEGFS
jgi:hypothetical protein